MKNQSIIINKIVSPFGPRNLMPCSLNNLRVNCTNGGKLYRNKMLFLFGLSYLSILFYSCSLYTTVVVRGNADTAPFGFTSAINTEVFDCKTGTFYVGLQTDNDSTDNFAISKGPRPNFNQAITFTGIAVDTGDVQLTNQPIEFLALSLQEQAAALLGIVVQNNSGLQGQTVTVLPTDEKTDPVRTDILNDSNSNDTAGIVRLAANEQHMFATVRPQEGDFGVDGSGIALIQTTLSSSTLTVSVKDANTGVDGNQAIALNASTLQVKGNEGGQDVIFATNGDANQVALHYDTTLQRLYTGLRIKTNSDMNDIGKSIVVARLITDENSNKKLELQDIVGDSAIQDSNQIVVARDINISMRTNNISVMSTSTGPSYLIVNGGIGTTDEIGNQLFALPLVNDPDNADNHGSLANKNSALVNGVFITPATMPDQVPTETDDAALIGTGTIPIAADQAISALLVVGDTAYVALNTEPDEDNDTGIFFSQALFDSTGKIIRWTAWVKRATPFNAFPETTLPGDIMHDGRVNFFAIDAKTGNAWIVEGTTGQVVGITTWQTKNSTNSLLTKLTSTLGAGCYSVLDLDQSTRGFNESTTNRYALFGGTNQVVFARVSQAKAVENINSPQTVISDFSPAENFLATTLPNNAGNVFALEYSQREQNKGNQNYFFAGTSNGLFVFTNNVGNGFNVDQLAELNQEPFISRSWQKISGITGAVTDIKSSGNTLYVLTFESSDEQPLKNTLYNIHFTTTTKTMFQASNINIIAETGTGIFTKISEFFGMQIIATGNFVNSAEKEQLALTTNQGLFRTNANQTVKTGSPAASTQDEAEWELIDGTSTTMFFGIGGITTPIRHTVWPFSIDDQKKFQTFERSSIHQLSGSGNEIGDTAIFNGFVPAQFNAQDSTDRFSTLDPITYFWSDGARRFFIFNRLTDPPTQNKLGVLPFDVNKFSIATATILDDHPTLSKINRFFWAQTIGTTGFVMAGTEQGIVALE